MLIIKIFSTFQNFLVDKRCHLIMKILFVFQVASLYADRDKVHSTLSDLYLLKTFYLDQNRLEKKSLKKKP